LPGRKRGQARRNNSRGVLGTRYEAEKRPKAHRGRRPDYPQSKHRGLELGVEPWRTTEAVDRRPQCRIKEDQAVNINVIARTCNNMIDDQLALTAIIRNPELKSDAPPCFIPRFHRSAKMDRHPILNAIPKPPRPTRCEMRVDKTGSPTVRKVINRAWKMGKKPRGGSASQRRNGRAQPSPNTSRYWNATHPVR